MTRTFLVAASLLVGSLALGCGGDDDPSGAGGTGGTAGGAGGGGGGEQTQVQMLQASVCSDYSGALDRIYITGTDAAKSRCLEVVLASGSGANTYGLSVPTGFSVERARLSDGACDTRVATPPRLPMAGEGEISFQTGTSGTVQSVSANFVLAFDPAGDGGPLRLGIELNRRNAPACFEDPDWA